MAQSLSATVLQHLLYAMLLTIAGYYVKCEAPSMTDSHSRTFQNFRRAVDAKFTQTRRVEDYAEAIGCSAKSLRRACLMACGSPPKALIEQRLILEAKRLLAHTGLMVEPRAYDPAKHAAIFDGQPSGLSLTQIPKSLPLQWTEHRRLIN
jgi:AraC-like DNA-binding protein